MHKNDLFHAFQSLASSTQDPNYDTVVSMEDVLMFNPVPKTGSQTFEQRLKQLSKRNGFSYTKIGDRANASRQYPLKYQVL